jgi:E3 ubiquitin-protein ligase MARCH6
MFQRAWWISDRPRPSSPKASHTTFHQYHNLTTAGANDTSTPFVNATFIEWTTSRPFWRAVSADIFAGQIIATFIVLTFVAVFLLREWISQNARPGVFEEDEIFEENRDIPPLEPVPQPGAQEQGQPQALPLPVPPNGPPAILVQPTVIPHPAGPGDRVVARERRGRRHQRYPVGRSPARTENVLRRRRDKGKAQHGDNDDDESTPESDSDHHPAAFRARTRRRLHSGTSEESEEELEFSRNLREVVGAAAMRRAEATNIASPAANPDKTGKFEFTFRAPTQLSPYRRDTSEPRSSPGVLSSKRDESTDPTLSPSSSSSTLSSATSPQSGIPTLNPSVTERIFAFNPSVPSSPVRRPPLPSTTLPNVAGTSSPPLAVGRTASGAQTPLASPSLATYRAPEELEAGPSTLASYFNQERLTEEDIRVEHNMYFRTPGDEAEPSQLDDIPALERISDEGESEEGNSNYDLEEDEDDDYEHVLAEDDDDDDDDDEEEDDGEEDGDALELDGEGGWEDDGDQGQEDEEEQRQQFQLQPAQGPRAPNEAPEANDDGEANAEDDMEGAMEAIGMRGPIYGVIQNVCISLSPSAFD